MKKPKFDVFLAHNSQDKPAVKRIAEKLRQDGLTPWLDEEQILGGDTPYKEIESGLDNSKSVVFFIGSSGSGQWQGDYELPIIVDLVIRANLRLIPVLLPGIKKIPPSPNYNFIRTKNWIAFQRIDDRNAQDKLFKSICRNVKTEPRERFEKTRRFTSRPEQDRRQFLKWVGLGTVGLITPVVGTEIWKWVKSTNTEPLPGQIPDILSSQIGIDYTRLGNLLAAGNWKEADQETFSVMNKALKSNWSDEALLNFPCKDLGTIDKLWVKYSDGLFGFSVQKKIYESLGGQADGKYERITFESSGELWESKRITFESFGDRVGWRVNSEWILKVSDVTSNVSPLYTSSPRGHLPFLVYVRGKGHCGFFGDFCLRPGFSSLASRLVNCNI
ncbi:GUN4 domain-containing protein [Nodularia spumigena]|uniref:GUN4 domain-containing protein n=1 Tax=Nodularia spumigena TaxID=70799 RepID=UPI00232E7C34|nr:GUN4 domain-containing protein [Nodularia spumigena]MDB9316223.1 GUN4 domain-containing protein [Nodularia spumigena CS-590/01A]MDB9327430.1 GUN4 domain-containing protein [Nodularia spumigena CS-590/02]MDB9334297.1 GUN4 domain-containing protein [Nodularia spumigena CS-590/01]